MTFPSEIFLFYFLPVTLIFYYSIKYYSIKVSIQFLSFASLIFYSWETPCYVFLMFFTVVISWILALLIAREKNGYFRKIIFIAAICVILGVLVVFKYTSFILRNLNSLSSIFNVSVLGSGDMTLMSGIALPLGISFYTFKILSYIIDVYIGKIQKVSAFSEYLCYVTIFPQLVAGPIARYNDLSADLKNPVVSNSRLQKGIIFFVLGLAKKVLIADSLEPFVKIIFDNQIITNGLINFLGVVAYTLQIYYDFSGYSEMAVGLGLVLGFDFPQNFNSPYKSKSISDFWTRWHMTLSFWFKDYLFFPMAMHYLRNKNNFINKYVPPF